MVALALGHLLFVWAFAQKLPILHMYTWSTEAFAQLLLQERQVACSPYWLYLSMEQRGQKFLSQATQVRLHASHDERSQKLHVAAVITGQGLKHEQHFGNCLLINVAVGFCRQLSRSRSLPATAEFCAWFDAENSIFRVLACTAAIRFVEDRSTSFCAT